MNNTVRVGERPVGYGQPPYIIAEIGINHNGDMNLGKELISAAKECGADAVKFQLFDRNTLFTDSFVRGAAGLADALAQIECTRDEHAGLKAHADQVGIDFASSAFTREDIDFLDQIGAAFFKIASMDTVNVDFIEYIASKGKATFLSTGLSNRAEIGRAVECFKGDSIQNLVLLHCVALYPPQDNQVNLAKMEMLHELAGVPVGFSDHTFGIAIPLAAIALGAVAIEKHFTLDKKMEGFDHAISANPEELRLICSEAKRVRAAIGEASAELSNEEMEKRGAFRRSIITAHALPQGHRITRADLDFKRPGTGIRGDEISYVIGRVTTREVAADELIQWSDLG